MTNAKREEIIAAMSSLLEQLDDSEPPKAGSTPTPDKVEMLTIKECTEVVKGLNEYTVRQLMPTRKSPPSERGKASVGRYLYHKRLCSDTLTYSG